ncbi:MAG: anthranilate phosphoribosyltransferase [Acidimicrobiia bacterium]|nr:anthranilate phosphoribosyltransferase [Acidimicrobiia bacterium]
MSGSPSTLDDHGGWPGVLGNLADGRDLSLGTAQAALENILAGDATNAQIAAFVVALRQKGETVDEMTGMVRAMIAAAERLMLPDGTIDIVGAGGSPPRQIAALNVSTMAAFVAAGAGAIVCKHGNRKASSTSGSFDLLEALGVAIDLDGPAVEACVREAGIGFAFARTFHPAMRFAGPVRVELGIPTVFNVLGPLSHPGRVTRQVIGVADHELGERMIHVLRANGSIRALVVSGDGGLDELSTTGPALTHELRDGQILTTSVDPAGLGVPSASADQLRGGDPAANAAIARGVFAGDTGPVRDIVTLNAAAGLLVAGAVESLADGIGAAGAAIDDGRVAAVLERLVEVSNRVAD